MQNNINKIWCVFENIVFEKRYLEDKWKKVRTFYRYMLIVFIVLNALNIFLIFSRGQTELKSIFAFSIFIISSMIFIFSKESFREKYIELTFSILFSILTPLWFYLDYERLVNLPHIIIMPFIISIVLLNLFPFNFLKSLIVSLIGFISSSTLIQNFESISLSIYIILFCFSYLILLTNKWKTEIDNRIDYSKSVTINETKRLMHQTLKRYFGDILSDKIIKDDGVVTGETKWVTICFTDISAYSTIVEYMSPAVAVDFLNQYFTSMHNVIEKHHGQILNYIGDSIMIVFGAPNNLKNHEAISVKCAIEMRKELKILNDIWDKSELSRYWKNHGIEHIEARIGLHTGNVIAGNIGSDKMLQYSTIGDVVNVASRLEQANKNFKTEICMSQEVHTALTKDLIVNSRFAGEITLKGRDTSSKVFTI
jgi:adenylate cyclase